ncbi:LOW QUALITY PROTEIN: polyprotein [Phytophthora megakarya]|uniref:Polyprotein n=1 Tax=Phytophthora megakarya TaxID=4795 RepID=A0A225X4S5_9STRA|nr:LOW QUALITY PROTEIN: polyprotein [Phytophthora megakarya]
MSTGDPIQGTLRWFKRKFGMDFSGAYSPVANMNSIRIVLVVCEVNGYIIEGLDSDTAFLNSGLKTPVYLEVPPFGIKNDGNHVCQLDKAIYGLKQTVSAWNKTIHQVYMKNGFERCGTDQFVYEKCSRNEYIYYVDEMIIAAKSSDEPREIDHDREVRTFMIKQARYIDDGAEWFGQRDTKRVDKPVASNLNMSKVQSPITDAECSGDDWKRSSSVQVQVPENGCAQLCSAEAEYMALSLSTQEVLWARAMLKDMGHEQRKRRTQTKHVDILHHFIRENDEDGTVKLGYIGTKLRLCMLKKAMETKTPQYLWNALGVKAKVTEP